MTVLSVTCTVIRQTQPPHSPHHHPASRGDNSSGQGAKRSASGHLARRPLLNSDLHESLREQETRARSPRRVLGVGQVPQQWQLPAPRMTRTQQVQRRGRGLKGNLRKQHGVGHPSQVPGPMPSSPFSDPPRLQHTSFCSPGLGLRASVPSLD